VITRAGYAERCGEKMNNEMEVRFTEKQGQYLAFIYNYSKIHGRAPAEADLERYFKTRPPTIHHMILKLEQKGLITRVSGQPRSIRLLIQPEDLPVLK
jgi:DNA-binding MarR family transcriptional regulator